METAVAMLHPDWKPEDVAAEVQRIYAEINIDLLTHARIALGGPGVDPVQELEEIPGAISSTDDPAQAEKVAGIPDAQGEAD